VGAGQQRPAHSLPALVVCIGAHLPGCCCLQICEYENCRVLLVDKKISTAREIISESAAAALRLRFGGCTFWLDEYSHNAVKRQLLSVLDH
jgi:hypothetical protein